VSKKRYVVELGTDERKRLEDLIRKGKTPAKKQLKARECQGFCVRGFREPLNLSAISVVRPESGRQTG
jgi:hypothetical protein